ncbi:MAG: hypothetical protein EOO20_24740 [Chryseobacterium sp.]|nr:MAG: hypothetical protein EOO20_24740 [Chryseobacterium sp.]
MAFRTIGILAKGGLKDLESEAARAWAGMLETYTLIESGDTTRLDVNLTFNEISDDMLKMFEAMWPKALQAVKSLSEANS